MVAHRAAFGVGHLLSVCLLPMSIPVVLLATAVCCILIKLRFVQSHVRIKLVANVCKTQNVDGARNME